MKFKVLTVSILVVTTLSVIPFALACSNMSPSAYSHTICTQCTDSGPVAQNTGSGCSYQAAPADVFCDCDAGKDCKSSAYDANMMLQNLSGECVNGVCAYAVFIENNLGDMVYKFSSDCGA